MGRLPNRRPTLKRSALEMFPDSEPEILQLPEVTLTPISQAAFDGGDKVRVFVDEIAMYMAPEPPIIRDSPVHDNTIGELNRWGRLLEADGKQYKFVELHRYPGLKLIPGIVLKECQDGMYQAFNSFDDKLYYRFGREVVTQFLEVDKVIVKI